MPYTPQSPIFYRLFASSFENREKSQDFLKV